METMKKKKILVALGSGRDVEELIEPLERFIQQNSWEYEIETLAGLHFPEKHEKNWKKFDPGIQQKIRNADLVLSTAGINSAIEALQAPRVLYYPVSENEQRPRAQAIGKKYENAMVLSEKPSVQEISDKIQKLMEKEPQEMNVNQEGGKNINHILESYFHEEKQAQSNDLFRIKEWYSDVFLWFLAGLLVLGLFIEIDYFLALKITGLHFVFLCLCYIVNSYADLEQDLKAGKKNILSRYGKEKRQMIVSSTFLIAMLMPLLFQADQEFYFLTYMLLGITVFYSLKPVRLKEKRYLGVITASLIQGAGAFILFAYLSGLGSIFLGVLIWLFLIEALDDITHQIEDYFNDLKANVNTLATEKGPVFMRKISRILFLFAWAVPLIYLFTDIVKGILALVLLGALTHEKYQHYKSVCRNSETWKK